MTVGHTPLVMVGVRVTPDTRMLVLALCTTDEECVRVQTQALAQNTPSIRTFSISVHALNSLFWKDPHEPLTQNSVTFLAEETVSNQASGNTLVFIFHITISKFVFTDS